MSIARRSRIVVFVLSLLVWLGLTTARDVQEVAAGVIVAALVTFAAGPFVVTTERRHGVLRRAFAALRFSIRFLWEMIRANLHVAYIVLHPRVPIRPGIVKVRTALTKDSALTVFSNAITLTPGTLTLDVDPSRSTLYVHWIDVRAIDAAGATEQVGGRFEKLLEEVFE